MIFSLGQALLAAHVGATYVSPFIGRLEDNGENGIQITEDIIKMFEKQSYTTKVLAASIRNKKSHRRVCAYWCSCSDGTLASNQRTDPHPLTDKGLQQFLADYVKTNTQ